MLDERIDQKLFLSADFPIVHKKLEEGGCGGGRNSLAFESVVCLYMSVYTGLNIDLWN